MTNTKKIRVAVAGYGFGRLFAQLFQAHPDVLQVGICETNPEKIAAAKADGFERIYSDYRETLSGDDYDAVYLGLPLEFHAKPTLDVLNAGKHCACAVPMSFTLEELQAIVEAERRSGKNYMMMETMTYTKEFLFIQDLHRQGEMGHLQFLRGIHSQSMEGWPGAWAGLPPMWYATHAVSPLLALAQSTARQVTCLGSGTMREELTLAHNNPYPIETMLFTMDDSPVVAEVTRTLFETAPLGGESFEVYGSKASFSARTGELKRIGELPHGRGLQIDCSTPEFSRRLDLLPKEFQKFKSEGHIDAAMHLVHEFVRSIVEGRKSAIDAVTAANWCAVGICGHASAMSRGKPVDVPKFTAIS